MVDEFKKVSPYQIFCKYMTPEELRERCKSLWSTVGIVMALVGTIAFAALMSPGEFGESKDSWNLFVYAVSLTVSSVSSSVGVVFITVAWAALESTAMEETTSFFEKFWWSVGTPAAFFIISALTLMLGTAMNVKFLYSPGTFLACVSLGGLGVLYLVGMQMWFHFSAVSLTRKHYRNAIAGSKG